jgi:hypothetical protein
MCPPPPPKKYCPTPILDMQELPEGMLLDNTDIANLMIFVECVES